MQLDGESGLPPLILERAGELAVEKAREAAIGVVRVVGVGSVPSAAPVAAGIAIGPMAGWVLGPKGCRSMALPTSEGLPLVVDTGLSAAEAHAGHVEKTGQSGGMSRRTSQSRAAPPRDDDPEPASTVLEGFRLGAELLVPEGGWLVAAAAVTAVESLSAFHERVAAGRRKLAAAGASGLLPEEWEAHRRRARHQGIVVDPAAWKSLVHRANRLAVEVPSPIPD